MTLLHPRDNDTATLIGVVPIPADLQMLGDAQLMSAVAEGSSSAIEQLYDRHVQSCFGLAMKITQQAPVAEEIVHVVFIKLWRQPQTISAQGGNFNARLLMLVCHTARDKLSQPGRRSGEQTVRSDL